MLEFVTRPTGHAPMDALLREAGARWKTLTEQGDQLAPGELEGWYPMLPADVEIPQKWAACFYLLPYTDQMALAFAWLHWWQRSHATAPGFIGWLHHGPGLALNHVSLLKVLTQTQSGVLGLVHHFLATIVEQAGDWNGNRDSGREIVTLLEGLDTEYRYNIHDRELWPAVLQLLAADSQ